MLTFEGCNYFTMRLILSTLGGKDIKIKSIRPDDSNPGIRPHEESFLRLLDKITNGSRTKINTTGTQVLYQPGLLCGGQVEHDCDPSRAIGYYLQPLMCMAPFTKHPLKATLRGVTNDHTGQGVDAVLHSSLPVMKRFLGTDEGLSIKIVKRGAAPEGGGEVVFTCPSRQTLKSVHFLEPGRIKRVRGVAWACRVPPSNMNRMVDSAKGQLLKFFPDTYITLDHRKGPKSGKGRGFGLTLVAESYEGVFYTAEGTSHRLEDEEVILPEDLAQEVARDLVKEVCKGGCVDSLSQDLAVVFMLLGQQNVSKYLCGPLTNYTIELLRHIHTFFGVKFKVDSQKAVPEEKDEEEHELDLPDRTLLKCFGVGFSNINKRIR